MPPGHAQGSVRLQTSRAHCETRNAQGVLAFRFYSHFKFVVDDGDAMA